VQRRPASSDLERGMFRVSGLRVSNFVDHARLNITAAIHQNGASHRLAIASLPHTEES
jgi:hypothetical protein